MVTIKVRSGEPVDRALRALKKRLDKEAVMKTLKNRRYHEKPSEKKKRKSEQARKQLQKQRNIQRRRG